ncbi:hypothetical protein SMICM17S_01949 [Streptomyces microflavus]
MKSPIRGISRSTTSCRRAARTSRAVFTSRSTPARPSCTTRPVSGPSPSGPPGPRGIRPSTRNESRAIRSTTGPTCISLSVALT